LKRHTLPGRITSRKKGILRAFNSTPVLNQEAKGNKYLQLIVVSLWKQVLGGNPSKGILLTVTEYYYSELCGLA